MNRGAIALALAYAAWAIGCGGTTTLRERGPALGVQSNEAPATAITLRVQPAVGARFVAVTEVQAEATALGQAMRLDYEVRDARAVLERRPDGTTVFSERTLGGAMSMAIGDLPPREEPVEAEATASTAIMDPRGRIIDDAMFAQAPSEDEGAFVRTALEPVLDSLAYPEQPIRVGDRWDAAGDTPLSRVDGQGTVHHELVQELVRIEGSGPEALAVIALRGRLIGRGTMEGGPASAELELEGAYSVGIGDGLVRGGQAHVRGHLAIGATAQGLDVPFEGTIRYHVE
ncbi:MAG: hypothetical protein K1X94_10730 [Sandaracinaceae bacterium]|nr:hypothetical protein [Sandaracinaceae bacterium]